MFLWLQEAASWKILKCLINIDLLYCSLGHHWRIVEVRQIYHSHTLIHHTKFQAACSKILWWNLENIQGFMKLNWTRSCLETVKYFLIKLGIKPLMHLLEISIFSLNIDIVRLTKIMNNVVKDLKILSFKVIFQCLKLV